MVHGGYTMIGQIKDKPIRRKGVPTAQVQRDTLMKPRIKKTQGNTNRHPKAKHQKTRKVKKKKL